MCDAPYKVGSRAAIALKFYLCKRKECKLEIWYKKDNNNRTIIILLSSYQYAKVQLHNKSEHKVEYKFSSTKITFSVLSRSLTRYLLE